jgi:peptide/nickel transport system substrate-binding protein
MTQFLHSDSIVGKPTAVTNFSHYTAIDDLLDKARIETDQEKQKKLYAEAQKKVLEDCVMIPTVIRPNFNGARRPSVDLGYNFKASMFYDYTFNEMSRILKR